MTARLPTLILAIDSLRNNVEKRTIIRNVRWPKPFPEHYFEIEPHAAQPMRMIVRVDHLPSRGHTRVTLEPGDDELIERLLAKKPLGWRVEA